MFVVIRETIDDEDLMAYSIIGCFKEKKSAEDFALKCVNVDVIRNAYHEEGAYCIWDFRYIPRYYRYVIQEVKINETVCD